MTRLLVMVVGSLAGAVVVRRLSDAARRATPERVADASTRFASTVGRNASRGVGSQVSRLTDAVVDFAATVREAAAEREEMLRSALGVDVDARGMDPDEARHLLEHPTQPADGRHAG
ncbi:hypothetical protein [Aquipuribacter hungaricus]|uniref:Secreted protein n=1 Tax=Aquipuribacter hungaricus TaxID=545624 RepID=A0ABV7WC59_9MICO